jgi:hypothetical protein
MLWYVVTLLMEDMSSCYQKRLIKGSGFVTKDRVAKHMMK